MTVCGKPKPGKVSKAMMKYYIDAESPIIPYEGMGGIKLNTHIRELKELVEDEDYVVASVSYGAHLKYAVKNQMTLHFDLCDGKLYQITALKEYSGKLFQKIRVDQNILIARWFESSFTYDKQTKLYKSPKGVLLEKHPVTQQVRKISIYTREADPEMLVFNLGLKERKWKETPDL